jgi:succinoglycan biosynthesis protein ExoU
MSTVDPSVCVIIAAKDAAATIGRAVGSALREKEVREVVVVDDGSTDDTIEAARTADDGTRRLRVIRLPANKGPSFARNIAINNSTAPLIGVLDADDFFFEGRFGRLIGGDDWDIVADNVFFIDEQLAQQELRPPRFLPDPYMLDLPTFVEGNIFKGGAERAELAYVHAVLRRSFLDAHALRYNPALRLGEDYDLYARALAKGARFKLFRSCGYGAVLRPDSLSGNHSTRDLQLFYEADDTIAEMCAPEHRATVLRHQQQIRERFELRRFLDIKRTDGVAAAFGWALTRPGALPRIIGEIAADKFTRLVQRVSPELRFNAPRCLLPGTPVTEDAQGDDGGPTRSAASEHCASRVRFKETALLHLRS